MHWTRLALGAAVLALAGPTFAQNLFTNGDFSADTAPTNQSATGWTTGGNGHSAGNGGVINDIRNFNGNYYWINDAPGPTVSISQLISFTPGNTLNLSGVYATRVLGSGSNSLRIQVFDNGTNTLLDEHSFSPTAQGNWTSFNYATSVINTSNLRVSFVAQVGSDDDYMIDELSAVSVSPTAAPEPTSALLGLLGVPFLLRRRK
ncbi:MAG: hypothetical protein QM758_20110 [Armatimonas sp.]